MSITRPSTLSPEEMDKLMERLANHGARITMADPRVTQAQTWILAAIGMAIIGLGGWLVQSVNQLNVTMMRVVTQNEARDAEITRIQRHIESVDSRVITLERRR